MSVYRVYRLDGVTRKTSAEWLEASSNEDAIARVTASMGRTIRCEIWLGARLVKRLVSSED